MTTELRHLDVEELIRSAGGDPWQLNRTVQSGSPSEISELATSFYNAGLCTSETSDEFTVAKQRFESAWDRQDGGEHPINDSAEVRRATESLRLNREQLSRIAVDLQSISASLAEAQRSGDIAVMNLDTALVTLDNQIDRELTIAAAAGEAVDISELKQAAVERTREALGQLEAIRDGYSSQLDKARLEMATEGYSAEALSGSEGQQDAPALGEAHAEADQYDAGQRAVDQALVNQPGPWTSDKQAASARLRDYRTVNDPTASHDQVRYAGQRLADYHTAITQEPLPSDPTLGGDARTQARTRLEMQARLEQGILGLDPIPPDQATKMLNDGEAEARSLVITRVQDQLLQAGMSPAGAAAATSSMAQGVIPKELVDAASAAGKPIAGGKEGFNYLADSLPTGRHWNPEISTFSPGDAEVLTKIGGHLGFAGNLVDVGVGIYEWRTGTPAGEVIAKTGGSMGGATAMAAAGAYLGTPGGPVGVAAGAFVLGTAGAFIGEEGGEALYKWLTGG